MSHNAEKSSDVLKSNEPLNKTNENISSVEQKFIENYNISLNTLKKLKDFVAEKKSLNILSNSQDELINLKDFIQASEISDAEKISLNSISDDSFKEFANEVFIQLEISKNKLSQLDSYIHWEQNKQILSTENNGYISNARFARACNPTKPHHHLDGCLAGITQSAVAISTVTWELLMDMIKTPYHTYELISWKANTDAFKEV